MHKDPDFDVVFGAPSGGMQVPAASAEASFEALSKQFEADFAACDHGSER